MMIVTADILYVEEYTQEEWAQQAVKLQQQIIVSVFARIRKVAGTSSDQRHSKFSRRG